MMMLRLVADDETPDPPALPHPGECLACFLDRMTEAHGCSNQLTWAGLWRDHCAPRATALERRLGDRGGYCDCEVLMNVYARPEWLDDDLDEDPEAEPPPCLGVRKGSTQPCAHWV